MTAELILVLILFFCGVVIAAFIVLLARSIVYMLPMLNGPVFVPSKKEDIADMIELAKLKKGDRVGDLGSGDGEIVIAVAKLGYKVDGYEINPILVRKSRSRIKELGLEDKAKIIQQSFWKPNFGKYQVVIVYGTTYIMAKLEKKLQRELKKNSRVISNFFAFPNWEPTKRLRYIHRYDK